MNFQKVSSMFALYLKGPEPRERVEEDWSMQCPGVPHFSPAPSHNHPHVHSFPHGHNTPTLPSSCALHRRERITLQREGTPCGSHTGAPYSAANEQVEPDLTLELVNLSEW
jgi:hypothetical protein